MSAQLVREAIQNRRQVSAKNGAVCVSLLCAAETLEPIGYRTVFGIAGSARVGGSARRALPGGADPGFWGAIFLIFFPKNSFLGDVCVEKIDFFGKLL